MNKTLLAVLTVAALTSACGAMHGNRDMYGRHHGAERGEMMSRMDTNGDGRISREEFMRAHEAQFDRMKGPDGTIPVRRSTDRR